MKFAYSENIRIVNKLSTVFSTINESMYFDVLEYMAMCYFRLGMYEDALEVSSNALVHYPGYELSMKIKAESLAFLDRLDESRAILRKHGLPETIPDLVHKQRGADYVGVMMFHMSPSMEKM